MAAAVRAPRRGGKVTLVSDDETVPLRTRREPPPLRTVTVASREELSPRMLRLGFEGPGLRDLAIADPGASVRLLVPSPGTDELVIPIWNGNEFLLPDGTRPALRTFTPLRLDTASGRLELEIVRHPGGAVSEWAERVDPGAEAAISGPGKGYPVDSTASRFVVLGDETALPAVSQLLEAVPGRAAIEVHVEVISEAAIIPLPVHPAATVEWHVRPAGDAPGSSLVRVSQQLTGLDAETRVWAAGEAASMQAIRTHLFQHLAVPRSQTSIRGYWKPVRS